MKIVHEYSYLVEETYITLYTCHLSKSDREYYCNIDFLYKCKSYPNNYECTTDWLQYEFGVSTIDEAIEITRTKEYQFLENNCFDDISREFGLCERYTATFINDEIVIVEKKVYYDI